MRVKKKAPMNPSHVLLGERWMNSRLINFLPKAMPLRERTHVRTQRKKKRKRTHQKYAIQSLQMMRDEGNTNLKE